MDRRWGGALMLFVVLVAAAVLPNLTPKGIPGVAVAAQVPGPPAVGDCLLEPATAGWLDRPVPAYLSPRIGPCTGARYGEVMAVIPDARSQQVIASASNDPSDGVVDSDWTADPNSQTCIDKIPAYEGLTEIGPDHQPSMFGTPWSPIAGVFAAPAAPSAVQRSAGQHWVACIVIIPLTTTKASGSDASVRYTRSIRNSLPNGLAPGELALCLRTTDLLRGEQVKCTDQHFAEAFAVRPTNVPGLTQAGLDADCRLIIGRLSGMADPTAGGHLTVLASASHGRDEMRAGLGAANDESGFAACLAVAPAGHPLIGPLLGLGPDPVPWAS